ncbi:O16 family O-antigen polymerase [soil metagenome]
MIEINPILIDLIFITAQLFLFLINYKKFKQLLHPATLFSFVWMSVIVVHFVSRFTVLPLLYPLSLTAYLIFLTGCIVFAASAAVVDISNHDRTINLRQHNFVEISLLLRIGILSIIVIGLPFYVQAAYRVFIASKIDDFLVGLRTELAYGDEDLGPVKYLLSFSFVVFAVNLYALLKEKSIVNKILFFINLIVTTVYAVLATGRTFFFMLLVIYMGIAFMINRRSSIKKYALIVGSFILLFMIIGIVYGKGGNTDESSKSNILSASEVTASYIVTPLNAFDQEIETKKEPKFTGDNSLRFFIKIGQALGFTESHKETSLIQDFVLVPYPTNVYTYYSTYKKDFGIIYAIIMLMIFAGLHTWLYNKAWQTSSLRYILYYSFLLYPLLISFFQDQYMSLFSTWLQFVFYIEAILFVNKFVTRKQ